MNRSRLFIVAAAATIAAQMYAQTGTGQANSIPAQYQTLYQQLSSDVLSFQTALGTSGYTKSATTLDGAELLDANGNLGLNLLNSGVRTRYLAEMQALKNFGFQEVTVDIGFPTLYQPFYTANGDPQDYNSILSFYQGVVSDAHSMGLKVVVESQSLITGFFTAASGFNLQPFFAGLSVQQFQQAAAQHNVNIYTLVQPDFLDLGSEPDTESKVASQPTLDDPTVWAQTITADVQAIQAATSKSNTLLGAGVGNWKQNATDYINALVAIPGLNYIDIHIYDVQTSPFNAVQNTFSMISAAQMAGKPVAASEWWLGKVEAANESQFNFGGASTSLLNAYSFWQPLDGAFLIDLERLANANNFLYGSAFWDRYFFSYINFDASMTDMQAEMEAESSSATALSSGVVTPTGNAVQNSIGNTNAIPAVASSASFTPPVAPGSLASIFGLNLASGNTTQVSVEDSTGAMLTANLVFVSPGQVNLVFPSGASPGPAVITITPSGGKPESTSASLMKVAPGIFTADGSGKGAPAAQILTVNGTNQTYSELATCANGTCALNPVNVNQSGTQVYLVLYGTGLSAASMVTATIGSTNLTPSYAGSQGSAGLDQVNILLPASLAGSGTVQLQITADGVMANPVNIQIQ